MASSGTVSLNITTRIKREYREGALMGGDATLKSSAVIEAADLRLRTIKVFIARPSLPLPTAVGTYFRSPPALYGSVNNAGSLNNAVTLRTLKGSLSPSTGTYHQGTNAGGSIKVSFLAIGA